MDSISEKITSRPGFLQAIPVVRNNIESFASRKERSQLVTLVSVLEMSEVIAMG